MSQEVRLRRRVGMWNWIILNRLAAFERRYGYDASYMRELLAIDRRAFWAFVRATRLGAYRRDAPRDVVYAAALTSIIAEDCGPCTQLGVAMALEQGSSPAVLAAIVRGDEAALPEDVALGRRFARAVIEHAPAADELRAEIERRWGKRAVVALAFAVLTSRMYPTVKYALGHGHACQRVVVGGEPVRPYTALEAGA